MKPSQIRCFWMYSLIVILLTMIPYALGFAAQDPGSTFTGFVFAVEDGNSYIAKMLLGASGDWLFRTPYSTQPQRGVIAYLPYILLGKLAGGTEMHLQLVLLFHLFRMAAIPLAIWATYRFMAYFLTDPNWAAWATVLATIGSGLGWLLILFNRSSLLGSIPLGFISPETFGFLAFLGLPHLVLARAVLLIALRWYLESPGEPDKAWRTGLAMAVLGLIQPLAMVPAYAVIGIHQLLVLSKSGSSALKLWAQEWMRPLARVLGLSVPVFAYYALHFSRDPFLRLWTEQNKILSPHPFHYLLAYALMLPFLVAGLIHAWRSKDKRWLLPAGWALIIPVLAYLPYNLQRRLPEGSWVALVLLAALGLSHWKIGGRLRNAVRIAVLVLSLITPMLLVFGGIQVARSGSLPAFRSSSEVAAFNWLAQNAGKHSVVLASFQTGNALPAWAPVSVVIGHGPESANLSELRPAVQAFFSGGSSLEAREAFIQEQGVDFVFYGPAERELGFLEPGAFDDMEAVYEDGGDYYIYRCAGGG